MIDLNQGQILDFGKKDEDKKMLVNLQQSIQHLKDVAQAHAQKLMDLDAETETLRKDNENLKHLVNRLKAYAPRERLMELGLVST